ncbi:hypothetical protein [Methylobacterium nigriterrae]|uniref:hypothetical protein n=1 Tax=Methylobacterium nigriterrae TaxID=3127512 RepID=UPI0030132C27
MAHDNRTGNARSISMSDFNARAKRIAERTGAVEKPERAPSGQPRRSWSRGAQQPAAQVDPKEAEPGV